MKSNSINYKKMILNSNNKKRFLAQAIICYAVVCLVSQNIYIEKVYATTEDFTVISHCEPVDVGNGVWNFNGSFVSDTANFVQGTSSILVTTNPDDNQAVMRRNYASSPLNINLGAIEDKILTFWLKINGIDKIKEMQVELGTTIDTQEYNWSYPYLKDNGWIRQNEWVKVNLPIARATVGGIPDKTHLNAFGIYIITQEGTSLAFNIDDIEIVTEIVTDESNNHYPNDIIINNCDGYDSTNWFAQSVSPNIIEISDKKEGDASLKFNYENNAIYVFHTLPNGLKKYNLGDVSNKELEMWFFVNEKSKIGYLAIELSSSGINDINEYQWFVPQTQIINGWNRLQLAFSNANITGNPDPSAINWMRSYYQTSNTSNNSQAVFKFDDIKVHDKAIMTKDSSRLVINRDIGILSGFDTDMSGAELKSQLFVNGDELRIISVSGVELTTGKVGTGTKAKLYNPQQQIIDTLNVIIYGDLNGDGKIAVDDLALVKNHLLIKSIASEIIKSAADIYKKGTVTISDLLAIKKQVLGIDLINQGAKFPIDSDLLIETPATINTNHSTSDIVIADYIVTNAPYRADKAGVADSTNAIQRALSDCFSNGGGTVWMPSGTYKVTSTINIPSFVTLRGDWRDPDNGTGSYGTVIRAEVASGDNGPVLFQIGGSAAAMGITTYYPGQNASSPVPFNYTFSIPGSSYAGMPGTYMSSSVINCTMLNSYRGIGINAIDNTKVHETSTIKNVKGTVLYRGVVAYNGADVGTWENITLNNSYWSNSGISYNAPAKPELDTWTRSNGTAFTLGDLEWDQFYALDCSNYNIGINIVAGSRMKFSGEFLYTNVIDTNIAVKVDTIDERWGTSFLRSTLEGSTRAIQNNSGGYVKVCDSNLIGGTSGTVTSTSPGTTPLSYTEGIQAKVTRTVLYDVTQAPYNAPHLAPQTGIPAVDATSAIQAALSDAGNAGGGIVYLPAGWYRINTHLLVPANVELRGSSSAPQRDQGDLSYGTALLGYEGKGTANPDSDTALVTLNGAKSGISGIRFFYPENNPAAGSVSSYPFCVRGNGEDQYVVNVALSGVYNGIDFAMNRCDRHFIRKIVGVAYSRFIVVGPSTEGWIEGCLSNSTAVCRNNYGVADWVTDSNVFANVIDKQTRPNEVFIVVYGGSNEHILNAFAYGCKYGVYITSGSANVFNLGTDNLGVEGYGVVRIDGMINVMNYMRYAGSDSSGIVAMYNNMRLYN